MQDMLADEAGVADQAWPPATIIPLWRQRQAATDLTLPPPLAPADRQAANRQPWYPVVKRSLDIGAAAVLLICLLPLFLILALLIKLDSRGPVFYRQQRVGRGGRPFRMVKFRSMRTGADRQLVHLLPFNETDGLLFKLRRDPRVTRVGRLLRRLSLDELPQLINVLLGEMSLVGPRPPLPREVARYTTWQHRRLDVTPGLTGLWQVSGRSDLSFDEGIALDLRYVVERSLLLDLVIIARTIPAIVRCRGAY